MKETNKKRTENFLEDKKVEEVRETVIKFLRENELIKDFNFSTKTYELSNENQTREIEIFHNSELSGKKQWIYIILLDEKKLYVGFSKVILNRLTIYFLKNSDKKPHLTRKYKPKKLIIVINVESIKMENIVSLFLMKKFGIGNVNGGGYSGIKKLIRKKVNIEKKIREQDNELRQINLF